MNEKKIAKLHVKFVLTKRRQTYLYTCFHTNFTVYNNMEWHVVYKLLFFLFSLSGTMQTLLIFSFLFGSVYVSYILSTKIMCQISARIMGFHFFYSHFICKFPKSALQFLIYIFPFVFFSLRKRTQPNDFWLNIIVVLGLTTPTVWSNIRKVRPNFSFLRILRSKYSVRFCWFAMSMPMSLTFAEWLEKKKSNNNVLNERFARCFHTIILKPRIFYWHVRIVMRCVCCCLLHYFLSSIFAV